MASLLLTLGHNASAIAIENNKVICGFEEERISGVKSDSRYPIHAIDECAKHLPAFTEAYISHWATDGKLSSMGSKYWNPQHAGDCPITTLSPEFSHHDAHAAGAVCFAGPEFPADDTMVLVIDGFGNFGEHLSLYRLTEWGPKLSVRYYGYGTSLGLMYQYATAYMGMKMHEDEYKLLGYEVHADESIMEIMGIEAKKIANKMVHKMSENFIDPFDPIIRLDALPAVQKYWIDLFNDIRDTYELPDPTTFEGRVAFAYLVQAILETVVIAILGAYRPTNLIVSGGVFYNVRLNFWLNQFVPGKLCIYPLAGDQGNALGLYAFHNPEFVFPDTLCWGLRDLSPHGVAMPKNFFVMRKHEAITLIDHELRTTGCINIVRGAMEFGPRALCNTSTLARAERSVVEQINTANGRNTVMPMAPVMSREMYLASFRDAEKIHKSEKYMVVSLEYNEGVGERFLGAAHGYPGGYYTGRPQVTDDPMLLDLLGYYGMLINTSFNVHGKPIVHSLNQAIQHHQQQQAIRPNFVTVVIWE